MPVSKNKKIYIVIFIISQLMVVHMGSDKTNLSLHLILPLSLVRNEYTTNSIAYNSRPHLN